MFLQFIAAILGISSVIPFIGASFKGFQNEERYLEYSLDLQVRIEENKKDDHEIELIRHRRKEECACRESRIQENVTDFLMGTCYHNVFEYSHWLRSKMILPEVQKEELKDLIEKVRILLDILEATHQHTKEEKNNKQITEEEITDNNEYEFIDWEIDGLAQEKEQWQKLIADLEQRFNALS